MVPGANTSGPTSIPASKTQALRSAGWRSTPASSSPSAPEALGGPARGAAAMAQNCAMQLHFIANRPARSSSERTIAVIDPSDGQAFDTLQRGTPEDID